MKRPNTNPYEHLPTYDLRDAAAEIRDRLQERKKRTPEEREQLALDCELALTALVARLHHADWSPGSPIYQMRHRPGATFRSVFMAYYDTQERNLRLEILGMAAGCVFGRPFECYRDWQQHHKLPGGGWPYEATSASREGLERSLEALEAEQARRAP